ncbi:LysM peptidoglycan-binding domain-containing protein [Bacillus carboniphilus]|uniref:LysM peptidoglycan-binding domain-containing protein n=1 Tax=Bacillus carboniphilus TaxID=86663 RepID=A0ABY9JVA9_9BACI|nr:peptidoglycan endopeptidase [Bacillus carboniphilus]WLR43346.1 LysM peptidoglycan-binding domain-containing protein [Bacillus carboniphilus]
MNKKIVSMTATAVLGSTLITSVASASTVKVQAGDTLWELSKKYNTSVNKIKSTNGLSTDTIYVGQILTIPGATTNENSSSSKRSKTQSTQKEKIHKVEKGDSLWKIAVKYSISIPDLKEINSLSSDIIYPGQKLTITKSNKTKQDQSNTSSAQTNKTSSTTTSSYTVKSGDSLWLIAKTHNISVSQLKTINGLENDNIYPGQKLTVTQSSNKIDQSQPLNSTSKISFKTYTVKAGDSLWKIANDHLVSIAEIKVWNNLSSNTLQIGQTLKLNDDNNNASGSDNSNQSIDIEKMIEEANKLIGIPYKWGGNTTSGFDCSGFVYYVLNKVTSISRLSSAGYWSSMKSIDSPERGDIVFFNTSGSGVSHMGIYLGDNEFIHSGSSTGVTISSLTSSYWKNCYLGAKRFY